MRIFVLSLLGPIILFSASGVTQLGVIIAVLAIGCWLLKRPIALVNRTEAERYANGSGIENEKFTFLYLVRLSKL